LKYCGEKIAQGAKWLLWDCWHKTENQTASNIHAVSQSDQNEVNTYNKDKRGWFRKKFDMILDFLKELTYVGFYERESKCLDCEHKGQLMCEIGGRIASDVVGFTFTMGAGYGVLKTAVTKFGPKVADILAAASKVLPKVNRGTKVMEVVSKVSKPVKWLGKMAVRTTKPLSKAVIETWTKLKGSKAYSAIMNVKNSKWVNGIKISGEKISGTLPAKIVIKTGRGLKNSFNAMMELDQKIFAKGASSSASLFNEAGIGMSKYQIAKMYTDLAGTAKTAKGATLVDKNGNQVMRVSTSEISAEQAAQLKRAGISLSETTSEGQTILRMPKKTLSELKEGKFSTRLDPILGIPMSHDGKVVVKLGSEVSERTVKDLTEAEVRKLREDGALFTTRDHPNALKPIDPNNLRKEGIRVGSDGNIVVKNLETGEIQVLEASTVKAEDIKLWQKKGYPITQTSDPEWMRPVNQVGIPEGDAISHTSSAKMNELRNNGHAADASDLAMKEVQQLNVVKESGEISDFSRTAKKELIASKKINPRQLDGIESSTAVETRFNSSNGSIEFVNHHGETRGLKLKQGGEYSIETYQDGKMAVVQDLRTGKTEIHDLSRKNTKVASFDSKESKSLNEAMAKTVNGEPADKAALKDVKTNLEMGHEKHQWIDENGESRIEIKTDPSCNPAHVEIHSESAR